MDDNVRHRPSNSAKCKQRAEWRVRLIQRDNLDV